MAEKSVGFRVLIRDSMRLKRRARFILQSPTTTEFEMNNAASAKFAKLEKWFTYVEAQYDMLPDLKSADIWNWLNNKMLCR